MKTTQATKQAVKIIEYYGLQNNTIILARLRKLMLNPKSTDAYQKLIDTIHSNPQVKRKILSQNPFATPPPPSTHQEGDVRIGTDENSNPYYINIRSLVKNLIAAASIGFGKTYFFYNLAYELFKQKIRFLWIDFKQDAQALSKHIPMLILPFNEKGLFKFNPLQKVSGVSRLEHFHLFISILSEHAWLMEGSSALLLDTLLQLDNKKDGCITIAETYEAIQKLKLRTPRPLAWRDSCLRALRMLTSSYGKILNCYDGLPIQAIGEHNTALDLRSAGTFKGYWGTFMPSLFLLWKISNNIRGPEAPIHICICDEGNHLLGKAVQRNANMGMPTILSLIQTSREFGEGFLISTNEPNAMAETAIVNAATKMLFRLNEWENISSMSRNMTLTKTQATYAASMEPGEAIIKKEKEKYAHIIQLDPPPFTPQHVSSQEIEDANKPILEQYPVTTPKEKISLEDFVPGQKCPQCAGQLVIRHGSRGKFIGCDQFPVCKHTENLTHDQPAQLTSDQRDLLWHIKLHPELSKTQHYKALGFSAGKADSLIKKIRHLVREIIIPTGNKGRQPVYLAITREAYAELGTEPPLTTRGAGIEHDFHINRYANQLSNAGYKAEPNFTLKNKECDIGITMPSGQIIAVEICATTTIDWEAEQIIKNLNAGFDHSYTLVTQENKVASLGEKARQQLTQEQQDKTTITPLVHDITELIKGGVR